LLPSFLSQKTITIKKAQPKKQLNPLKLKKVPHFKLLKGKKLNRLKTVLVSFLLTLGYLSYLSFIKLDSISQAQNLFLSYVESLYAYFNQNHPLILPIAIFTILPIFLFLPNKKKNIVLFPKHLLISTSTQLAVLSFSLLFSFTLLFAAGFTQINYISGKLLFSSAKSHLIWDKNQVVDQLKNLDKPPLLISSDKNFQSALIKIELDNNNLNPSKYYSDKIIPSVPNSPILSLKIPHSSLLLYKNYLLINELNKEDIGTISPIMGKLFAKQSLDPKYIKDEPNIEVLGRQEYLKYREEKLNQSIKDIQEEINRINGLLSTAYGIINDAKQNISTLQSYISTAESKRESDYSYCKSAGYYSYYFGTFYKYYSDSECERQKSDWNNIINGYHQSISEQQQDIQYAQSYISGYQSAIEDYELLQQYISDQKASTPQELGVFISPKTIKIALDTTSKTAVADYFATLAHEYLHYTSYVSDERSENFPLFFEEGLTEFFARKTIKQQLQTDTNLGYPIIVSIIKEIAKTIPEDELIEIYFTKDIDRLYQSLNNAFGNNFYEDSEIYFTILSYLGGNNSLKYANNIMFRIGGEELTEADLISTFSEF